MTDHPTTCLDCGHWAEYPDGHHPSCASRPTLVPTLAEVRATTPALRPGEEMGAPLPHLSISTGRLTTPTPMVTVAEEPTAPGCPLCAEPTGTHAQDCMAALVREAQ